LSDEPLHGVGIEYELGIESDPLVDTPGSKSSECPDSTSSTGIPHQFSAIG
jgi:hypothetical protein